VVLFGEQIATIVIVIPGHEGLLDISIMMDMETIVTV